MAKSLSFSPSTLLDQNPCGLIRLPYLETVKISNIEFCHVQLTYKSA